MLQEPEYEVIPIWCHECGTTSIGNYNRNWQQCAMCRNYMCEAHLDHDCEQRPPLCWLCKEACGEGEGLDLDLRFCTSCRQVAYFRKGKCLNRNCDRYICRPGAEGDFNPYQRGDKRKNRSWTGDEMSDWDRQQWGPKRTRNKGRKRVQWWADRMAAKGRQKGDQMRQGASSSSRARGSTDAAPPDDDAIVYSDNSWDEGEVIDVSEEEVQPHSGLMEVEDGDPEEPTYWPVTVAEATTFAYVVSSFASWTHSIHTCISIDLMCSVYAY
jgi:hypothetical protein